MRKKQTCPDCGDAPTNHFVSYVSVLLGAIVDPYVRFMEKIIPESFFDWLGSWFIKLLIFLRLGRVTKEPTEKDSGHTRVLWEEAIRRGIEMSEFHLFYIGNDIFLSNYKGGERSFSVLPKPKKYNEAGSDWMDNKNEMKKHFRQAGIPMADGGVAGSVKKALKIFHSIRQPVITKPNLGSRSRHTTTHLMNEKDFVEAFKKARQLSPWVMIEEELSGYVFRGTLIGKKFIAALRREPEDVIGDGIHTIRELVDIENKNPLRQGPIFHHICTGAEEEKELCFWHHTWNTIPKKDEIITLGQKTSRGAGGGITDVTDIIHPDNIELLEKIAKVLDDPLMGVDFIMEDASKSWKEQPKCGVIECNSAPFIDLHSYPLVGKPHNVASALWDIVYPESKTKN